MKNRFNYFYGVIMKKTLHFTQDGYNKIIAELKERKTKVRREIADRIDYARRLGDLSENSAYKAALEERTVNEKRIRELDDMISRAKIIEPGKNGEISVGSEVRLSTDGKEIVYRLVGAMEANPAQGMISNESPIGISLIGHRTGDEVSVQLPTGSRKFKIIDVK